MKDKKKERKRTRASRRVVEEIAGGKAVGGAGGVTEIVSQFHF